VLHHDLDGGATLSPFEPWRAAELAAHVERHRAHLEPWLPWARRIVDVASAREFLQGYADKLARDEARVLALDVDGELTGGIAFRTFDAEAGTCELGVWIAPRASGRGLVTRACQAMIEWACGARGIRRVEWRAVPGNTRSIAVAMRLGMTRDGVLRSAVRDGDTRQDLEIWALTRP
jgi:ribosomal-protein-serine acetyltransferase